MQKAINKRKWKQKQIRIMTAFLSAFRCVKQIFFSMIMKEKSCDKCNAEGEPDSTPEGVISRTPFPILIW